MKAVMLSAGRGTRFGTLTKSKPKCLLKLHDLTLLDIQLETLNGLDMVEEIIIVVGFERDQIISHVSKANMNKKVTFIYNENYLDTNNMFSLSLTEPYIKGEQFLLINGDVIFNEALIGRLSGENTSMILVQEDVFTQDNMKCKFDSEAVLTEISKKIPSIESMGISLDIFKISSHESSHLFSEIRRLLESGQQNLWIEDAISNCIENGSIRFIKVTNESDPWGEIDNVDDLNKARVRFFGIDSFKKFEIFLLDIDGTLMTTDTPIDGAQQFTQALAQSGKTMCYLTNNSAFSNKEHKTRLETNGFFTQNHFLISSLDQTILFLEDRKIQKVFVVGTKSARNQIQESGIFVSESDPECIIICNDIELTYDKLERASHLVNRGIPYVVTHSDISRPTSEGPVPDAGTFYELIKLTTRVLPIDIFGKPSVQLARTLIQSFDSSGKRVDPSKVIMIGDRLETDIAFGQHNGFKTCLVLSGSTKESDFQNSDLRPDYVIPNLKSISHML